MSDSYIVIGFDDPAQITAGFDRLATLAAARPTSEAASPIRIVDVEFVHSIHGVASTVPAGRVDPGLAGFDHLDARLLTQGDLDVVAALIPPGARAAVVVYADAPILPVLAEWSRAGASVLREGSGQPGDDLLGG